MKSFLGFCVLQSMLVAGAIAAWFTGLAKIAWDMDPTRLSVGIGCFFLYGLYTVARGRFDDARWTAIRLVQLGMMGTILGLMIAVTSVDPSTAGDPSAAADIMTSAIFGVGIALMTTLAGLASNFWLQINVYLLK